jgi:hypothetical protein
MLAAAADRHGHLDETVRVCRTVSSSTQWAACAIAPPPRWYESVELSTGESIRG